MLNWLRTVRRAPVPAAPALRLSLESLDERALPSAASITGLGSRVIGSTIIVYGEVQDDSPVPATVTASGGINAVVTTRGRFEFIAPYTGNGAVSLSVQDDEGLTTSALVNGSASLNNQAPYVTMQVAYGVNRSITLNGMVYDENPAATLVTIGGAAAATVNPDASGSFSITVTASSLGDVTAQALELSGGLQSELARVALLPPRPQIQNFQIVSTGGTTYTIVGQVVGDDPEGLNVVLSSEIGAINGQTVTVSANGWFELTVNLPNPADCGMVFAVVQDWWGQISDEVDWDIVR